MQLSDQSDRRSLSEVFNPLPWDLWGDISPLEETGATVELIAPYLGQVITADDARIETKKSFLEVRLKGVSRPKIGLHELTCKQDEKIR